MKIPIVIVVVILLGSNIGADGALGINWGRMAAQKMLPSQVVDLILQNGIQHARIFTSEIDIMEAFAGSGISLTVGIHTGVQFKSLAAAKNYVIWKREYIQAANIRRIIVGEKVFYNGLTNKTYLHQGVDCLKWTQRAFNEANMGYMKASMQHYTGILKKVTKPSEAEFADEIKEEMIDLVNFLKENDSPFMIEMFPNYDTTFFGFDPRFAFPSLGVGAIIDGNATYTSIFEFVFDCFVTALDKIQAPNMKIIVAHIGWPTDGCEGCNVTSAEQYYKYLLPYAVSSRGTPRRPGSPIDIFLHSLTDENKLENNGFPFTRHWGIYRSNGLPKYKIDLSGRGQDIYPTIVKGLKRMPDRWCVFNTSMGAEKKKVDSQFEDACNEADCTSLAPGGSCSQLTYEQSISYAFNMLFQFKFQVEKFCNFDGLAYVTVEDPSTPECLFPVEVVKNELPKSITSAGERVLHQSWPNSFAVLVFLLSIFGTLTWDLQ